MTQWAWYGKIQYTHPIPWIRVKKAFSQFDSARNRFPCIELPLKMIILDKKFFWRKGPSLHLPL